MAKSLSTGSSWIWLDTVDPGVSETNISVGNLWLNTSSNDAFICKDATGGAQVWDKYTTSPVSVANGGTGLTTLTGLALGSGTSALTGVTYVPLTSFTPSLTFGGASTDITYDHRTGYYIRIGSLVYYKIDIQLTDNGTATGSAAITGLPIASADDGLSEAHVLFLVTWTPPVTFYEIYGQVNPNATTITLVSSKLDGTAADLTEANIGNSTQIKITGVYNSA